VPAGMVIGSSPAASDKVKKGGSVTITVSRGPKPIPVPDQAGRSADSATTALRAAGFLVAIAPDRAFSDTVDTGAVVSVTPKDAQPGSLVTLTLSKGAQAFPVPSVTGLPEDEAVAKLAAEGFTNVKVNKWFFGNTIRSQQPEAGTDARHKDPVSLYESPLS